MSHIDFYRTGAIGAERPCVISWMRPLCRDSAELRCVAVAVVTQWGRGHNQAFSPRLLTPAISCEIWKDFSLRSHSLRLWRADSCCRGGRVGSNLHRNMSRSVASSVKLCWSEANRTRPPPLPEWRRREDGGGDAAQVLHRFYSCLVVNMAHHQSEVTLDWTGCFIVDARYHWQSPVVCEPFKYKYNENKWFV